ncbi:MAG: hypothetical protein RI953_808 [Pseudomonadota bacterium]
MALDLANDDNPSTHAAGLLDRIRAAGLPESSLTFDGIINNAGVYLDEGASIASFDFDAFRRVGLPYSGTHVLRHGGCRRVYNATKDLAVAQMLLGNADMDSTLVYAKRDKSAVHDFAKLSWVHDRAETPSPQQAERPEGISCGHN